MLCKAKKNKLIEMISRLSELSEEYGAQSLLDDQGNDNDVSYAARVRKNQSSDLLSFIETL